MSQSHASRERYAFRRDLRIRRDKAAIALMVHFLQQQHVDPPSAVTFDELMKMSAQHAVAAADVLIGELDRTRPAAESAEPAVPEAAAPHAGSCSPTEGAASTRPPVPSPLPTVLKAPAGAGEHVAEKARKKRQN